MGVACSNLEDWNENSPEQWFYGFVLWRFPSFERRILQVWKHLRFAPDEVRNADLHTSSK